MRIFRLFFGLAGALALLFSASVMVMAADTGQTTPSIQPGFACPSGMQWSVNTPIPSCVPTGGGMSAPIPCNGGTVSWTTSPGVVCEGPVGAALNGVTSLVTANNGRTGTSSFTCANGAWAKSGTATCVSAACAAGTQSWTSSGLSCAGAAASMSPGGTVAVVSSSVNQGSAQFTCDLTGAWGSANPGATCSQSCAARAATWSGPGAAACSGSLPAGVTGQSVALSANSSTGVGNSTWTCSGGVWGGTGSCALPPPPPPAAAIPCDASTVYWKDAARTMTCIGSVPSAPSGFTAYAMAENVGVVGNASVICGSDGNWGMASGSCAAGSASGSGSGSGSAACTGQQMYWNVSGNSCDAYAANSASGGTAYLADAAGTTTGSAQVTCSNGTWGAVFNKACGAGAPPPPPPPPAAGNCPAGNQSWSQGTDSCVAYAPSTPAGGSAYLSDTTAPTTGTGAVACGSSGAWGVASGQCSRSGQPLPPPAQGCAAQTFTYKPNMYSPTYVLAMPAASSSGSYKVSNNAWRANVEWGGGWNSSPTAILHDGDCVYRLLGITATCSSGSWSTPSWRAFQYTEISGQCHVS